VTPDDKAPESPASISLVPVTDQRPFHGASGGSPEPLPRTYLREAYTLAEKNQSQQAMDLEIAIHVSKEIRAAPESKKRQREDDPSPEQPPSKKVKSRKEFYD
jgi:hypothetical protein